MLTVHHLGLSQSDRIVWLCEELAIPYTLKRYERDPVTRLAPAEYKALHPAGTAPVITDGDVVLAESEAIIDYIVARHGGGRLTVAADDPAFATWLYWYHYVNGSMMPALVLSIAGGALAAPMQERLDRGLGALDAHLANGHIWLAGDMFTVADIMMLFPLTTMRAFVPYDLAPYPAIRAYIRRVAERPAFVSAMAKADPGFAIPID